MSPAQSLHSAFTAAIDATTANTIIVACDLRRDVAERTRQLVDVLREEGFAPEATVLEVKRIARFAGANPEYHSTILSDAVAAAIAAYFR
jgi:ribosomal protein L4